MVKDAYEIEVGDGDNETILLKTSEDTGKEARPELRDMIASFNPDVVKDDVIVGSE